MSHNWLYVMKEEHLLQIDLEEWQREEDSAALDYASRRWPPEWAQEEKLKLFERLFEVWRDQGGDVGGWEASWLSTPNDETTFILHDYIII